MWWVCFWTLFGSVESAFLPFCQYHTVSNYFKYLSGQRKSCPQVSYILQRGVSFSELF